MKKTNKIFTIILSMIMCLSLFPVTSQAATAPQIGHAVSKKACLPINSTPSGMNMVFN